MTDRYDSRPETRTHIEHIQRLMAEIAIQILLRSREHDASKLVDPELSMFDEFTPKLQKLTYGSQEYKAALAAMGPALQHHYAVNRHHPEHWPNGVADMNLVDIVEMLCDWKAATLRHADGDIEKSILINGQRFGLAEQLAEVLRNTARSL